MPGQGTAIDPVADARLTAQLNTPYARMVRSWQLWNLDAARKGREEIPWDEWGLSGTTYDPTRITERAWNAYNTIGSEQASNARGWNSPPPVWTPEPFENRFHPGSWAPGTIPSVSATATAAAPPVVNAPQPTPQPHQNLAQIFGQAQSAPPATVHPMATRPSEIQQSPMQQNALMNLFNFPTLRTKKPAQASGGVTTPGQYNENFWNAWRI